MWLTEDALEAMVITVIASGVAQCDGCTLPLHDADDLSQYVTPVCYDCNKLTIWHKNCAPPEVRVQAAFTSRRVHWRWN